MANFATIRSVETYGRLASRYARAAAAHLRELHFDELIAENVDANWRCNSDLRRSFAKPLFVRTWLIAISLGWPKAR